MGQRSPGMGELTQLWGRGISSDVGHGRAGGGGGGCGTAGSAGGSRRCFSLRETQKGGRRTDTPAPPTPPGGGGRLRPALLPAKGPNPAAGLPRHRARSPAEDQDRPPPPPSTAARSRTAAEHTLLRMALGCSRPSTGPRVPPGQRSEDHRSAGSGRTHRSESTARSRGFLPLCDGNHGCGARQKGLSRAARSGGRSWGGCGARDPPRSIPKRLRL